VLFRSYFVCTWDDNLIPEDADTVNSTVNPGECSYEYLQNLMVQKVACEEAGYSTEFRYIQEVHYDATDGRFYDGRTSGPDRPHLDVVFKLYPWEAMLLEEAEAPYGLALMDDTMKFGQYVYERDAKGKYARKRDAQGNYVLQRDAAGNYTGGTLWIEPPYKMLWSNKGLLAVLWKLFQDDPVKSKLLIPAWFEGEQPDGLTDYVRKPLLSCEGANVEIWIDGKLVQQNPGPFGEHGYVIQAYEPPPNFPALNELGESSDNYPILGVWFIDGEPAGLDFRENYNPVTDKLSFFAPYVIRN
jgi:glutathionylspermidine synthase